MLSELSKTVVKDVEAETGVTVATFSERLSMISAGQVISSTPASTVTVVVQVSVFPAASVMVSVTVLSPMLEQSKLVMSSDNTASGQLSAEGVTVSSTSAVVILARPSSSNVIVNGAIQFATGASLSVTVTVKVQVATPSGSPVASKVTVVSPTGKKSPDAGPSICVTVKVAVPSGSFGVGVANVTFAPHSPASFICVIGATGQSVKVGAVCAMAVEKIPHTKSMRIAVVICFILIPQLMKTKCMHYKWFV